LDRANSEAGDEAIKEQVVHEGDGRLAIKQAAIRRSQ